MAARRLSDGPRAALAFAVAAAAFTVGFGLFALSRAGLSAPGMWPVLGLMGAVSVSAAAGVGAASGRWFAARAGRVLAGALGGMAVATVAYAGVCVVLALIALRPGGFFGVSTSFGPGVTDVGPALVWLAAHSFGLQYVLLPALPFAALAGARLVWRDADGSADPDAP